MGSETPQTVDDLFEVLSLHYSASRQFRHPILGPISLHSTTAQCAYPLIFYFDKQLNKVASDREFQQLAQKSSTRPAYFLKQIATRKHSYDNFCSDAIFIRTYFEYVEESLSARVKFHREKKSKFRADQVLAVLRTLAKCLTEQHASHLFLTELTSSHVLIGKHFAIKVIDHECVNSDCPVSDDYKNGFSDPELLRCLQTSKTQLNNFDPFKANIWAAGLVLLEMTTLQSTQAVYHYDFMRVDFDRLRDLLSITQREFGTELAALVSKMLVEEQWNRLSASALQKESAKLRCEDQWNRLSASALQKESAKLRC